MPLVPYWMAMAWAWMPLAVYHLFFTVPALFFLRDRALDQTARAVWAQVIVSIPIFGVLAFVILQPGRHETT